MFKRLWRKFVRALFVGGVAAAMLAGGSAYADDKDDLRALKEQLEAQKKQIEDLQKQLGTITQPAAKAGGGAAAELPPVTASDKDAVEKIVGDYLKRRDDERKAQEAAAKAKADEEGFKVGSDLSMSTRWNIANGVTFSTPNKDFVAHIGARFQMDSVWWNQSNALLATPGKGGIGDLQDGVFFRRIRPSFDGTAWEVLEWNLELALEQIQNDVINLDQFWAGLSNVPYLGRVWIGHLKTQQGLEGDTTGSSKSMTFLERSMYTDAFYQNFCTGVVFGNAIMDQRLTYAFQWYRQDNGQAGFNQFNNGADFSDGSYGYTGRVTALPIWQNDGRCFLHLGASYTWRNSERPFATAGNEGEVNGPRQVEFRARPQLRDAIGDYGGTSGNNAAPVGLSGDARRVVDTGVLTAPSNQAIGTELFYVRGPFSVMAEYGWAAMDDAITTSSTNVTSKAVKAGTHVGTPWFSGGYVQVGYFLTGENRTYDRRLGTVGGTYITAPYTPFWITRADGGGYTYGRGAWEVAARFNYLDLNDKVIRGGRSDAVELGVNWFLNNNMKIQFLYLWQNRYDLGTTPGATGVQQLKGDLDGFAIRTQFFF
jgi:phosphate-selective porin OprO/OprP